MANTIYIGGTYSNNSVVNPNFTFGDNDIKAINISTAIALVSDELSIDDFVFTVEYEYFDAQLFAPFDYDAVQTSDQYMFATNALATANLSATKFGIPVWYFKDNALFGKFYVSQVKRVNKIDYEVSCISAIGLLDTRYHVGGVYTGTIGGHKISDVIASIMDDGTGSPIIPYTCDVAVGNTYVYGWLPVATKRENLHQVLFAYAITIIKNADGSVRFTFLNDSTTKVIPDSRVFLDGTVDVSDLATSVEVTEHSFRALSDDREVTLFDNTDGSQGAADNSLIYFSESPCHDITASSGLTLHSYGENYAIVSGTGTITGKVYTHVSQVRKAYVDGTIEEENVKSVTECTLITPLNSENAVKRLLAYYSAKKTVSMDIDVTDEKCGDQISFTNPFDADDAGYIVALDTNVSSFMRARATVVTGYQAQGFGNYYTHSVVLTGNGTWTVPSGANSKIRVVLVGGGDGGNGGYDGADGSAGSASAQSQSIGAGGTGGNGGTAGTGGKILSVDLNVSVGDTFSYACGNGGSGGSANGGTGTSGGNTTFGTNSSASGASSAAGAVNLLTGEVFGINGTSGVNGGDGASSIEDRAGSVTFCGNTYQGGIGEFDSDSVVDSYYPPYYAIYQCESHGGGGGGASVGENGENSDTNADWNDDDGYRAVGGDGANANAVPTVAYGQGGNGGHGGGGGGGGGWYRSREYDSYDRRWTAWTYYAQNGGVGGTSSAGSSGGAGCIIIYY